MATALLVPEGQNGSQAVAAGGGMKSDKAPVNAGVCLGVAPLVAESELERAKGFEPSTEKSEVTQNQAASKPAPDGYTQLYAQILDSSSPDLAKVIAAWAKLPAPLKAAILAIIATSENQKEGS